MHWKIVARNTLQKPFECKEKPFQCTGTSNTLGNPINVRVNP